MKKDKLRSGYTTGACAAAAAKAAVLLLLDEQCRNVNVGAHFRSVEIPFPDGNRHEFKIRNVRFKIEEGECIASASVIKDAGDDPDVTHGAEIAAEVKLQGLGIKRQGVEKTRIVITGGKGVGRVTKPGLPMPIGEAAINPVPRRMIEEAVMEAIDSCKDILQAPAIEITISVPQGEELARKTLNSRLGIVGGISILGTTGIVKPVSTEAWTATITSSMNVAKAMGYDKIVLSAGRSSEKAHMHQYNFPEEAYVLMGDYLEYALKEAKRYGFKEIHLCAQWAKMVKIAMATPQTHVRFGAIDIEKAVEFLQDAGAYAKPLQSYKFNTAREIFDVINTAQPRTPDPFTIVCNVAKKYAQEIAGDAPVITHLVSYDGKVIADSE